MLSRLRLVAVLALASLALPALAMDVEHPFRVVLLQSPAPAPLPGTQPSLAAATVQITPLLYIRPALGPALYRGGLPGEDRWQVLALEGGAGVAWCPPGWRLTPELLALDLRPWGGLQADGTLRVRALFMLTVAGWVSFGAGPDCAFPSGGGPDVCRLAVAVGAQLPVF